MIFKNPIQKVEFFKPAADDQPDPLLYEEDFSSKYGEVSVTFRHGFAEIAYEQMLDDYISMTPAEFEMFFQSLRKFRKRNKELLANA